MTTCPSVLSIFELLLKSVVLFALLRAPLAHLVLLLVVIKIILMMIIMIIDYNDDDYKIMMIMLNPHSCDNIKVHKSVWQQEGLAMIKSLMIVTIRFFSPFFASILVFDDHHDLLMTIRFKIVNIKMAMITTFSPLSASMLVLARFVTDTARRSSYLS